MYITFREDRLFFWLTRYLLTSSYTLDWSSGKKTDIREIFFVKSETILCEGFHDLFFFPLLKTIFYLKTFFTKWGAKLEVATANYCITSNLRQAKIKTKKWSNFIVTDWLFIPQFSQQSTIEFQFMVMSKSK